MTDNVDGKRKEGRRSGNDSDNNNGCASRLLL